MYMHDSLISIIVPVYNAERYINKCIDSILSQTYTNWELLLINDGSTDKSLKICQEYLSKDSRIKVFDKINGGVSSARNLGIENSNGVWITFIDSDDWVENNYLHNFIQEYDISLQGYYRDSIKVKYPESIIMQNPGAVYLSNAYMYGPVCKLFKTDLIKENNIKFDLELSYGEDILFLMQYIIYCKTMYVSDKCGYHYTNDNVNSLTKRKKTYEEVYNQYTKHMKYFEKIMNGSSHSKYVMHKQTLGMLIHFAHDYGIRYKDIRNNEFMNYYYHNFLNIVDKIFILLLPFISNKFKVHILRLLLKYYKKINK